LASSSRLKDSSTESAMPVEGVGQFTHFIGGVRIQAALQVAALEGVDARRSFR
jgi:hypothetical protein